MEVSIDKVPLLLQFELFLGEAKQILGQDSPFSKHAAASIAAKS